MLKIRVIPTLLHQRSGLVKGVGFAADRRIGTATQAIRVFRMRDVDELLFLDVAATREGRAPDLDLIDELADDCSMPLTVGGGVRTVADIERLLMVGADKVAINSAALADPSLIEEGAKRFGVQCIVVSIDARRTPDGYEVYAAAGTAATGRDPVAWAREAEARGAGEIVVTSVERDGTMRGFDIDLVARVSGAIRIPTIASGGAGKPADFVAAVEQGGAAAVAAGAIFQFTETTPRDIRDALHAAGYPVRRT
jgi:cyclase